MAKYRVSGIEERADSDIACDTYVLVEKDDGEGGTTDIVVGHFTVVLHAVDVLEVAELSKPERIARYLELFYADERIQGLTDSAAAVTQMEADVVFPVEVAI